MYIWSNSVRINTCNWEPKLPLGTWTPFSVLILFSQLEDFSWLKMPVYPTVATEFPDLSLILFKLFLLRRTKSLILVTKDLEGMVKVRPASCRMALEDERTGCKIDTILKQNLIFVWIEVGSCWDVQGSFPGLPLKSDGKSWSRFWMPRTETTFLRDNGAEG